MPIAWNFCSVTKRGLSDGGDYAVSRQLDVWFLSPFSGVGMDGERQRASRLPAGCNRSARRESCSRPSPFSSLNSCFVALCDEQLRLPRSSTELQQGAGVRARGHMQACGRSSSLECSR
eukprot:5926197-Pleurochrysis_carterae.AAC.1